MEYSQLDCDVHHQRSRQWIPLITQQLRLRHLHRIIALNIVLQEKSQLYFTLHLTTMSAPFYTSDKVSNINPKWPEIDPRTLVNKTASAIVLRIWQFDAAKSLNRTIVTWGINFTGLVYLGSKASDIQPVNFNESSVILQMHDGYFTSFEKIKGDANTKNILPYVKHGRPLIRVKEFGVPKGELARSYKVDKLRKLHSLQLSIRNKNADVQIIRDKLQAKTTFNENRDKNNSTDRKTEINSAGASSSSSSTSHIKYAPQLLTMTSLNKMLYEKPTSFQKQEMVRVRKEIETSKFRVRLLVQQRTRKLTSIRRLKENLDNILDDNDDLSIKMTHDYHLLEKEWEQLQNYKQHIVRHKEILMITKNNVLCRKRQLLKQLLFIYPIIQISENKYTIHGVYLPNSDVLAEGSYTGVSVALGYVAHILKMCSIILQVPLRYPIVYFGSRSSIIDNMSSRINDKDREFPLFTRGREKMEFTYAVYLLNKNIAQLRWLFFIHTTDLKATSANLLGLLSTSEAGKLENLPLMNTMTKYFDEQFTFDSSFNLLDSTVEEHAPRFNNRSPTLSLQKANRIKKGNEKGPGLSEILTLPEIKRIKKEDIPKEATPKVIIENNIKEYIDRGSKNETNGAGTGDGHGDGDTIESYQSIEKGTDLLNPNVTVQLGNDLNTVCLDDVLIEVLTLDDNEKGKDTPDLICPCDNIVPIEDEVLPSDTKTPSISTADKEERSTTMGDSQHEFLRNWLKDDPSAFSYSDENYSSGTNPEGSISSCLLSPSNSPLTARTDALLSRKSFNLVKHDYA